MVDLEFSPFQAVAGILLPILILIWKILSEEGSPALPSKQASFENGFKKEGRIFQRPPPEKILRNSRVDPFDPLLQGGQSV